MDQVLVLELLLESDISTSSTFYLSLLLADGYLNS